MNSNVEKLLFPLLLVNITTSANLWTIAGIGIGQTVFWVTIALAFTIATNTPYRLISTVLLISFFGLRIAEMSTGSTVLDSLKVASLGFIYAIAGAKIYGRNPAILHKQLIVFFVLSIPVMLLQVSGASSFFMGWNTEYAHDLAILDPSEIGTFKVIPVYRTLFVGLTELNYQIGQGRPVGLLYSNNVLSIFVAIVAALNIALAKDSRSRGADAVVSGALALTMSLLAFLTTVMVYLGFAIFGAGWRRTRVLKLFAMLLGSLAVYWLLFPGLFLASFSDARLLGSLLTRTLDLANVFGWATVADILTDQRNYIGSTFDEEATYSLYSKMLKSELAGPAVLALVSVFVIYVRRLRLISKRSDTPYSVYAVLAAVCVLTQFGVPYVAAPSFQLILGLAFFPLFRKLWGKNFRPSSL